MGRPLTITEILHSADAHREIVGSWPTKTTGPVLDMIGMTWDVIDKALRYGRHGLPRNSSLARLLAKDRGKRNRADPALLTENQILAWADAHHQQTGNWPMRCTKGIIPASGGDTWSAVSAALSQGKRGLPGGSSLAQLLAARRNVPNHLDRPFLTQEQILAWADAHHARGGEWPSENSGAVLDAPGEFWSAVNSALMQGLRDLPANGSLALLLGERRGKRNVWTRPDLSIAQILSWADAYYQKWGAWPRQLSGSIPEGPAGETWTTVNNALKNGRRGLDGGSSLAKLLHAERGAGPRIDVPNLNLRVILAWAHAHFARTGKWPNRKAGKIEEAPEETWNAVESALANGGRGLEGGSSLAQLLAEHGKKRNVKDLPDLSLNKVLAWADAYHDRTGKWPNTRSGAVAEAPEEDWGLIAEALRQGKRGFPRAETLNQLLVRKGRIRDRTLPLPEAEILHWADLHFQRTGKWPTELSGEVQNAPGELWSMVNYYLREGKRGLARGSSLAKLLATHRTTP